MTETDVIPTSASVASTGLGIRYIGDHAYAYSGAISFDNTGTVGLNFTSGVGYIVAKLNIDVTTTSADDVTVTMSFNEIDVYQPQFFDANHEIPQPLDFIIPPRTIFRLTFTNSDATVMTGYAVLKGRVYGEK